MQSMNKKKLLIFGAGEQGLLAKYIAKLSGYDHICFLDDYKKDFVAAKLKRYSDFSQKEYDFFVSFGNQSKRKEWINKLLNKNITCVSLVHPTSYIEPSVQIGNNCFIGAKTYVNHNTSILHNCIVNSGCIIEHNNDIEEHVQIAPGVITGGGVTIKESSFIGIGTVIRDHVSIVHDTIVGAGAVVTKNLTKTGTYVGIPARLINT